eukprot:TRINITY_DN28504_c0_g1_i1.p1 TRINITY_DN28504_c0_g1~~TRINITY_DN28504_c0_g1_i1.p1  ORF type:complete len:538 (+),score=119.65 TRINITY_DN28504_c0_g1_i1:73-1686(+)
MRGNNLRAKYKDEALNALPWFSIPGQRGPPRWETSAQSGSAGAQLELDRIAARMYPAQFASDFFADPGSKCHSGFRNADESQLLYVAGELQAEVDAAVCAATGLALTKEDMTRSTGKTSLRRSWRNHSLWVGSLWVRQGSGGVEVGVTLYEEPGEAENTGVTAQVATKAAQAQMEELRQKDAAVGRSTRREAEVGDDTAPARRSHCSGLLMEGWLGQRACRLGRKHDRTIRVVAVAAANGTALARRATTALRRLYADRLRAAGKTVTVAESECGDDVSAASCTTPGCDSEPPAKWPQRGREGYRAPVPVQTRKVYCGEGGPVPPWDTPELWRTDPSNYGSRFGFSNFRSLRADAERRERVPPRDPESTAVTRIRERLQRRLGGRGFCGLRSELAACSEAGAPATQESLSAALKFLRVCASPDDTKGLLSVANGRSVTDLLCSVRASMPHHRDILVRGMWRRLGGAPGGVLSGAVLERCCDAERCPVLQRGQQSPWKTGDTVTEENFVDLHADVSACVLGDEDFEDLLLAMWPERGAA